MLRTARGIGWTAVAVADAAILAAAILITSAWRDLAACVLIVGAVMLTLGWSRSVQADMSHQGNPMPREQLVPVPAATDETQFTPAYSAAYADIAQSLMEPRGDDPDVGADSVQ